MGGWMNRWRGVGGWVRELTLGGRPDKGSWAVVFTFHSTFCVSC